MRTQEFLGRSLMLLLEADTLDPTPRKSTFGEVIAGGFESFPQAVYDGFYKRVGRFTPWGACWICVVEELPI